jgi:hypothetical protein
LTVDSLVLRARAIRNQYYESCWYKVSADTDEWQEGAELIIQLDASSTASMYVYPGTDRRNVTQAIESNQTMG